MRYAETRPNNPAALSLYIARRTPDTSLYSAATYYRSACAHGHYDWLRQSARTNVALFNTGNASAGSEGTQLELSGTCRSRYIRWMLLPACLFLLLRLQVRRSIVIQPGRELAGIRDVQGARVMLTDNGRRLAVLWPQFVDNRVLAKQYIVSLLGIGEHEHPAGYQTLADNVQHLGRVFGI